MFCLDGFCDLWAKYVEWWNVCPCFPLPTPTPTLPALLSPLLPLQYLAHSWFLEHQMNVEQLMLKTGWVRMTSFFPSLVSIWREKNIVGFGRWAMWSAHTLVCELIVPIRWVSRDWNVNFLKKIFVTVVLKQRHSAYYHPAPRQGNPLLWSSSGDFLE